MKKKVELCGYFDSNFGDDYIQKIAVHYMPEYDFVVSSNEIVSPILLEEKNVTVKSPEEIGGLRKLMVTGSGFMINSLRILFRYELLWFLQRKRVADFCVGCNIEPFSNRFKEWLVIQKLRKFKFIICRDKKSHEWFLKNCPRVPVIYTPDILFSMPNEWICPKNDDGKLGIAMFHRNGDSENELYYRQMAEIADYWVEKNNKGVILMAFDTGIEDDVFSCQCVKKLMKHSDMAEIAAHGQNGEIIKAYASCKKIVGARFHSAVLALKTETDFYPIIYREKMRNIISDFDYLLKGDEITDISTEKIIEFLDADSVGFRFDEKYSKKTRDGFELLKKHMEELM